MENYRRPPQQRWKPPSSSGTGRRCSRVLMVAYTLIHLHTSMPYIPTHLHTYTPTGRNYKCNIHDLLSISVEVVGEDDSEVSGTIDDEQVSFLLS